MSGFGPNDRFGDFIAVHLFGGGTITLAVALSGPAPAGGESITVTSSSSVVPSGEFTVAAGAETGTGSFSVAPVAVQTAVELGFSAIGSKGPSFQIVILPPVPISFPADIGYSYSGYPLGEQLRLSGPAAVDTTFYPTTKSPYATCTPCTVPAGQNWGNFTVNTVPVPSDEQVTVSLGLLSTTFKLGAERATANFLNITLPFFPGQSSQGTVSLLYGQPQNGYPVYLTSSSPDVAVTSEVAVPINKLSTTFTCSIRAETPPGLFTITAKVGQESETTTFLIADSLLRQLTVPASIPSGTTATGTVRIAKFNSTKGATIALSSDQPFLKVPSSIYFPPGQETATFPVVAADVPSCETATITASEPGVSTANAGNSVSSLLTPVSVGFNGLSPPNWGTTFSDAQNSSRALVALTASTIGWSNLNLSGQLTIGSSGNLYVSSPPSAAGDSFTLTALNAITGTVLWSQTEPTTSPSPQITVDIAGSPMVPTPDGIAYLSSTTGATKALYDPSYGTMVYLSVLPGPADRIYFVGQDYEGTYVGAINISNDTFSWVQQVNPISAQFGNLATDGNDHVYISAGKLYAFAGASGRSLWTASSPFASQYFGGTAVVGHGGVIYAESYSATDPGSPNSELCEFATADGKLVAESDSEPFGTPVLGWEGQVYTAATSYASFPDIQVPYPNGNGLTYDSNITPFAVLADGTLLSQAEFFSMFGQLFEGVFIGSNYANYWVLPAPLGTGKFSGVVGPDGSVYVSVTGGLYRLVN